MTYYFEFCRLLGEFLLPTSNILPCTYWEIYVIMKEFGMEYQAIDACPNDHIIYYGQYALENECPHNVKQVGIEPIKRQKRCLTKFFIIFW